MASKLMESKASMHPIVSYGTLDATPSNVVTAESDENDSATYAPEDSVRRQRVRALGTFCCFLLMIVTIVLLIIGLIIYYFAISWACYSSFHPHRNTRNYSDFKNQTFTVGFDLSAGYGTVAVSFWNGTVVDVARVEASEHYNKVLKRLSAQSAAHPSPPYYNCGHSFNDIPRQWVRHIRKKMGRPASDDVAALAEVLGNLKTQVDLFLLPYGVVEMAHIIVPHLPAIYVEDLLDAAEHVNVQFLTLPIFRSGDSAQWPVTDLNAAMAGNSIPLALGYVSGTAGHDLEEDEENNKNGKTVTSGQVSNENTFLVLYTQTALTAFVGPFYLSTYFYGVSGIVNFTLGLAECTKRTANSDGECTSSSPYWLEVRDAIKTALYSYGSRGMKLGQVVSWGEAAHNEIFAALLEHEVLAAQETDDPEQLPQFLSNDPVFAAARGAAEFGKVCATSSVPWSCVPEIRPRMQGW